MKYIIAIQVLLMSFSTSHSQVNLLDEVITINVTSKLDLLPNTPSFETITELYENDSLTNEFISENFYNYDTLRLCFSNTGEPYNLLTHFCQLRKINNKLSEQTTHYLYDPELEQEKLLIYWTNEKVDSVKYYENGKFERTIKFSYLNDKLIKEEQINSRGGTLESIYTYGNGILQISREKQGQFNGKLLYYVNDSIVTYEYFDEENKLEKKKEYVFLLNEDNLVQEKKEFEILSTDERILRSITNYWYHNDRIEITESRLKSQTLIESKLESDSTNKTIEYNFLKSNKKRIKRYSEL